MKIIKILSFLILLLLVSSCSNDEKDNNERENITTLSINFTPEQGTIVTMIYQDLDGPGGNDPTINGGSLIANTSYNMKINLLDESKSPTIDRALEILEEGFDHQFFFSTSQELDININYNDFDVEGKPIGIENFCTVGNAGFGTLDIVLRHQPDKYGLGVSDGIIDFAQGRNDIKVSFDVIIF